MRQKRSEIFIARRYVPFLTSFDIYITYTVFVDLDDIEINDFCMINMDYNGNFDDSEGLSTVRLSCFAHTVQLCVSDGLKNSFYMSKVLSKCKLLSKFSHK